MSTTKIFGPLLLAVALAGCGGGGGSKGGDGGGNGGGGNGGGGGGNGGGTPTFTVGGTATGLKAPVTLKNNGQLLVVGADGTFTFTGLPNGTSYTVTVDAQPSNPAQNCVVTKGSGTVANANVTDLALACTDLPLADLQADANVRSSDLSWTSPADASSFTLYVSSARNCDVKNFASCPDGARFLDVTSPHTVDGLRNGQPYYFRLETTYANGARGLSNEAGARPESLAFVAGQVTALARAADGTVYIGGNYRKVGVANGSAVPVDSQTGRLTTPDFPLVTGGTQAIVADGAGGWYIGGDFDSIGGVARNNFAHILASGAVDPAFQQGTDSSVQAIAIGGDGTVYIGGRFLKVGTADQRHHLAAFSAAGELLPWAPDVHGFVFSLATAAGVVYAGGDFDLVNNEPHDDLVAIDAAGAVVSGHLATDSRVSTIAIADGIVYVGGDFTNITDAAGVNSTRFFAAAINAQGELQQWNPQPDDEVHALTIVGSTLYLGGAFGNLTIQGVAVPRARLAAVNKVGELLPWNPGSDGAVNTLAVSGDRIFVGGAFTQVAGEPRSRAAAIRTDGQLVSQWHPAMDSFVDALSVSGNTVYVGGTFSTLDAKDRGRLAALDASGRLKDWDPKLNSLVSVLTVAPDGTLYVGGAFTAAGQETRVRLAAFDANGGLLGWQPQADEIVRALAVDAGIVYVGGSFTHINGENRARLAAIDTNGTLMKWAPGANSDVFALRVANGAIYIGGLFTQVGQLGHKGIAAVLPDGGIKPWPSVSNFVSSLEVVNGILYIGGNFDSITQVVGPPLSRGGLAALTANGEVLPWAPRVITGIIGGTVTALSASGTNLYLAGSFEKIETSADAGARKNLAAVGIDETLLPWNPGASLSPSTSASLAALVATGDAVYVGGSFHALHGVTHINFGAIHADGEGEGDP